MDNVKKEVLRTPVLFPYEPDIFWEQMRLIIREEITLSQKQSSRSVAGETPGLTCKPLFKLEEVRVLFNISRTTIYDWIRAGKLTPFKVRSRIYFLSKDIDAMIQAKDVAGK